MKSKYIINGISLDIYCKENNLNFRTQSNRVREYIKKHPELSESEAIKLALSKCGTHSYGTKYWYGNISLAEYCRQNDKNYYSMVSRVEDIKKELSDISDNEAVRISIEDYNDRGIKYFYNGIPLVDYCRIHPEYLYSTISLYIRRKKEKYPNLDTQEIIDTYFKIEHQKHTFHFIDGIPLIEYCNNNDIIYRSVLSALSRMRNNDKYKNLTEQERLKLIIDNYKRPYLFFEGMSLYAYCKENNYLYNTVFNYVINMINNNPSISYEEAISSAINTIKRYGIIYYYKGIPLVEYCQLNDLRDDYIRSRILLLLQSTNISLEEAIEESVSYYERKKRINNINKIFGFLKSNPSIEENLLSNILLYLQIDYNNYLHIKEKFNTTIEAIYFIWYFGIPNNNNLLTISEQTYKDISLFIESITNDKDKVLNIDLTYLIGIYKSNLYDSRYLIILHQENYHHHLLISLMQNYSIYLNKEEKEDIINDTNLYLLELIDLNNNNNIAMVISYLNKCIRGFIIGKLLLIIEQRREKSIYSPVYKKDSSKKDILLIDKMSDNQVEDIFGDEVKEVIKSLDSLSKHFIYYKFYECLSYDEISTILNIPIEELKLLEKNTLERLSSNETLKKLVKSNSESN